MGFWITNVRCKYTSEVIPLTCEKKLSMLFKCGINNLGIPESFYKIQKKNTCLWIPGFILGIIHVLCL